MLQLTVTLIYDRFRESRRVDGGRWREISANSKKKGEWELEERKKKTKELLKSMKAMSKESL